MVDEKPTYVWVYYHKLGIKMIYNFSVGFVSPPLPESYLIQKIRIPKMYSSIIQAHLKQAKFRELGLIECIALNPEKTAVTLSVNEPLKYFADESFRLAKNTGFGSYLLLAVAADLKKKGAQLIRSEVSLSFEGKGQLRKAELEHHKKYNINDWQRGIAKNVRFAKRRLI